MYRTRSALAVAFVGAVALAFWSQDSRGDDKKVEVAKEKLVALWEATPKSQTLPKGSTVEFTKDGKLHLVVIQDKDKKKFDGTYAIKGDKLDIVVLDDGKEHKETLAVLKLTDTELVVKDMEDKTDEFTKAKK